MESLKNKKFEKSEVLQLNDLKNVLGGNCPEEVWPTFYQTLTEQPSDSEMYWDC